MSYSRCALLARGAKLSRPRRKTVGARAGLGVRYSLHNRRNLILGHKFSSTITPVNVRHVCGISTCDTRAPWFGYSAHGE